MNHLHEVERWLSKCLVVNNDTVVVAFDVFVVRRPREGVEMELAPGAPGGGSARVEGRAAKRTRVDEPLLARVLANLIQPDLDDGGTTGKPLRVSLLRVVLLVMMRSLLTMGHVE